MPKVPLREEIFEKTSGLVTTASDLLLLIVAFTIEAAFAGYGSSNVYKAYDRAFEDLMRTKVRTTPTLRRLKSRGLIRYSKGGSDLRITEEGRKRLESLVPRYDSKRIWDGRLYLITYDIPENQKSLRESLRESLKKIGCGMLQASVWITPYDPREILRDFVSENNLLGYVLISDMGKDGNIAGESIKGLVSKVYNLSELNQRYKRFLELYASGKFPAHVVAVKYLAILRDDPQVPFELLPKDWVGDESRSVYQVACGRNRFSTF